VIQEGEYNQDIYFVKSGIFDVCKSKSKVETIKPEFRTHNDMLAVNPGFQIGGVGGMRPLYQYGQGQMFGEERFIRGDHKIHCPFTIKCASISGELYRISFVEFFRKINFDSLGWPNIINNFIKKEMRLRK